MVGIKEIPLLVVDVCEQISEISDIESLYVTMNSSRQELESNMTAQSPTGKESKDATLDSFKAKFEEDDPDNPKNFSAVKKVWIVFQMSLLAMVGALGSSIISPGESEIAEYTNVSKEVTALTVALFVLGEL